MLRIRGVEKGEVAVQDFIRAPAIDALCADIPRYNMSSLIEGDQGEVADSIKNAARIKARLSRRVADRTS